MALHHVRDVIRPLTLEEAWQRKLEHGPAARFLGGGIDVVLYAPPTVSTLIDLEGLDLSGVREDASWISIGAMTTMTEAIESATLGRYASGFLVRVLKAVASPLQRNLATFGGTLGSAHPWSDVIPALLVLEAELAIYDGSERTVALGTYLDERKAGESPVIRAIRLPKGSESARGAFASFTRTGFDVPLLNVTCLAVVGEGAWKDVRIAIGGTPGLAKRRRDVEEELVGRPIRVEGIAAAARSAADAIDARDDVRASAGYRRRLARALVERCLLEIVEGGAE